MLTSGCRNIGGPGEGAATLGGRYIARGTSAVIQGDDDGLCEREGFQGGDGEDQRSPHYRRGEASANCWVAAENHVHNVEFAELVHDGCGLGDTEPSLVLTVALDVLVVFPNWKDMVVTV